MDNDAIKRHSNSGLSSVIEQYVELHNEHLQELKEVMVSCGIEANFKIAA